MRSYIRNISTYRIFLGILPTAIVCVILIILLLSKKEADIEFKLSLSTIDFISSVEENILEDIPVKSITIQGIDKTLIYPERFYYRYTTLGGRITTREISWGIGLEIIPLSDYSTVTLAGDGIWVNRLQAKKGAKVYLSAKDNKIEIKITNPSELVIHTGDKIKFNIKQCRITRVNKTPIYALMRYVPDTFWFIPRNKEINIVPKNNVLRLWITLPSHMNNIHIPETICFIKDIYSRLGSNIIEVKDSKIKVNGKQLDTHYISISSLDNLSIKNISLSNQGIVIELTGSTKTLQIGKDKDTLCEYLPCYLKDIYYHSPWVLVLIFLAWFFATVMAFIG